MRQKVVAHFLDHRLSKGWTEDFFPNRETFHLTDRESGVTREVRLDDLKALFFVKSFLGNPEHQRRQDVKRPGFGRKILVRFKDGERMCGYTSGYSPERPGFFLFPADPDCNNERILVRTAATDKVEFV